MNKYYYIILYYLINFKYFFDFFYNKIYIKYLFLN